MTNNGELSLIKHELKKMNRLKEQELKQQRFFIELIEEVLPIDDVKKRKIHERTMRWSIYD